MTDQDMIEIASKLGAAGLLGVILWHVLFKVGTGIVAGIGTLSGEVRAQTQAIGANTAAVARLEGKLDHQMTIIREQQRQSRQPAGDQDTGRGRVGTYPGG